MSSDLEFQENPLTGWCQQLPSLGCRHFLKEADIWQNNVLILCNGEKIKTQNRATKQWQKIKYFDLNGISFCKCHDYSAKHFPLFHNISNFSLGSNLSSFPEKKLNMKNLSIFVQLLGLIFPLESTFPLLTLSSYQWHRGTSPSKCRILWGRLLTWCVNSCMFLEA